MTTVAEFVERESGLVDRGKYLAALGELKLAERDLTHLTEQLQRAQDENEHLRRALWLAQHPEVTTTQEAM